MPPDRPQSLQDHIKGAQWEQVREGESGAGVYRLTDKTVRYLKITAHTARIPVKEDYLRLQWLQGKITVPQIVHYAETKRHQFLLMEDCPGHHPFHSDLQWTIEERIRLVAQSAREFHAIPAEDCPFQMDFPAQLARAKHNIAHYPLRDDLREKLLMGREPEDILAEFASLTAEDYDPVLTHGDLYPVNIRVDESTRMITGLIDAGRMAIADRYTDLAPIVNAIDWHFDEQWITRFFDRYGVPVDEKKLRVYRAIHHFL